MEIDERLRSTSDQLLETIEQLSVIETEKRALPPGSPRFQKLAREAERLADSVVTHAEDQADLGDEAAQVADELGGQPFPSIDETPRDVTTILSDWRDAERRVGAAEPGSAEASAARHDVDRLRREYQQAHRAATRAGQHRLR